MISRYSIPLKKVWAEKAVTGVRVKSGLPGMMVLNQKNKRSSNVDFGGNMKYNGFITCTDT